MQDKQNAFLHYFFYYLHFNDFGATLFVKFVKLKQFVYNDKKEE